MLVHNKNPRGVLHIAGYRIWGIETKQDPVDVPFVLYAACQQSFHDATYREGYLREKFGFACEPVAFTYKEVRWLADVTLDMLGLGMVDNFDSSWSRKHKIDTIKIALREINP